MILFNVLFYLSSVYGSAKHSAVIVCYHPKSTQRPALSVGSLEYTITSGTMMYNHSLLL